MVYFLGAGVGAGGLQYGLVRQFRYLSDSGTRGAGIHESAGSAVTVRRAIAMNNLGMLSPLCDGSSLVTPLGIYVSRCSLGADLLSLRVCLDCSTHDLLTQVPRQ